MQDKLKIYKTIDPIILAFLLLSYFFKDVTFFWIAVALLFCNVFFSNISGMFAKYWLKFATFLGLINSKIVLLIAFFLFLTPLAYFYRIFNVKMVSHFKLRRKKSYYYFDSDEVSPSFFNRQW